MPHDNWDRNTSLPNELESISLRLWEIVTYLYGKCCERWCKGVLKRYHAHRGSNTAAYAVWKSVRRYPNDVPLHTKLVSNRKKRTESIKRYKTRPIVCGTEELKFTGDNFSHVANFAMTQNKMCLTIRNGCYVRPLEIENSFPHGRLNCSINVKVSKLYYHDIVRSRYVLGSKEAFMAREMWLLFGIEPLFNVSMKWVWKNGKYPLHILRHGNFRL